MADFLSVAGGLLKFLWKKKVWWLAPVVLFLILAAGLIVFGKAGVLSSFVYALF